MKRGGWRRVFFFWGVWRGGVVVTDGFLQQMRFAPYFLRGRKNTRFLRWALLVLTSSAMILLSLLVKLDT